MESLGIMGGTRDFLPDTMIRREFVIDKLKCLFRKYGFEPLETPAIERLETLTGKYGEEGEKLIYQVVNSGSLGSLQPGKRLEHALRYDLTVPLARVVAMYGDEMIPDPNNPKKQLRRLPRPFKRYQVQPVWRGDRPGQGRFREFYQCDADVVGATSLLVEAELIALTVEAFKTLGFMDFTIKINHRKLLAGLIAWAGVPQSKEATTLSSIDKLDKLSVEAVQNELQEKGLERDQIEKLFKVIALSGAGAELLSEAGMLLQGSETACTGIAELQQLLGILETLQVDGNHFKIDLSLARGLDYYTGTIWEVVTAAPVGSVGAGGRYDGLISTLSGGLVNQPACGTSFGLDRLLAAMEHLDLLQQIPRNTEVLVLRFIDPGVEAILLSLTSELRKVGVRTEIGYNDAPFSPDGMRQQLGYANEKGISFAVIMGPDEMSQGVVTLRNLQNRQQSKLRVEEVVGAITSALPPR